MQIMSSLRAIAVSAVCFLAVFLIGCGIGGNGGNLSPSGGGGSLGSLAGGKAIQGMVHGGQNPVYNATIQLYEVGTSGYTSAATPLLVAPVTTNMSGEFTFTGDYTCPAGSYVYIVASGGSPQLSASPSAVNNNLTLGAALGQCSNLTSSTYVTVNEETTIALAYALAQFASGTAFGTPLVAQPGSATSAPADNFATSSTNVNGLANAMAVAQLLVSTATGTAPGSSPSSSVSGVNSVTITNAGSGYTTIPSVTFSAPASGTTATGTVGVKVGSVTLTSSGSGYTNCSNVGVIFSEPDELGGTQATGTVACGAGSVAITSGGTGYGTTAPTVTFSSPATGTTATGTAVVNGSGVVTGVTITNPGSGYTTSVPTVTFSGGSGSGATGTATLGVASVTLANAGANYTTYPTASFTGSAVPPTATVTLGGVTNVNISAGSGYTSAPTVTFAAPASGTTATATASIGTVSTVASGATAEWWQVNLLANMLAACVNSTGGTSGDGSTCGTLFSKVGNGGTAPADTLQAALDMALYPAVSTANITSLYGLIPASAPFNPYPSTVGAVTDFSIGIEYQPSAASTALLKQPAAIALDSLGNAWVTNQSTSSLSEGWLVELTPTGVPIPAGVSAGAYPSDFIINSYSASGSPTSMGGQWVQHNGAAQFNGLFAASLDTSNNIWINDRQNNAMVNVAGSGTTYSTSLTYQNGGNSGAVGTSVGGSSAPTSTYVDGAGDVWFQMEGVGAGNAPNPCAVGLGTYTEGLGGFLAGATNNAVVGKTSNWVQVSNSNPFMAVDPNVGDTAGGNPIPGAPFLWTIAGKGGASNGLVMMYTQSPGASIPITTTNQGCVTPMTTISTNGNGGALTIAASATALVPSIASDTANFMATGNDLAFDKYGNLWIANQAQIDSQTTNANEEVKSSISKITPNYGASFSVANTSFAFSVFHQVASLYDGISTYYPQYLASDGGGNIWFTMSSAGSKYVNALNNAGSALSPYTPETEGSGTGNATGGFAGSVCTSCTFNGSTATYQRPNTVALGRPAIDQSGNVWLPSIGTGGAYIDLLVGIAVPKANPDSAALANSKLSSLP